MQTLKEGIVNSTVSSHMISQLKIISISHRIKQENFPSLAQGPMDTIKDEKMTDCKGLYKRAELWKLNNFD